MNFKDIIYEMLINENDDKRKAIERRIGYSSAWAEEFYELSEKHCIWIANSFLNDYIETHKKTIEKKYNKPIKGELDLKRAAREILNTTGPRNLIWREDYGPKYQYILDWLTSPRIAARIDVKIYNFKQAYEKSTIWHESLETGISSNYKEENEIIIDYRTNGVGIYWANLNTSMSEEEKRRMGHCGNDSGKVLFSLRGIDEVKDGRSYLTISYDPKTKKLGQMKGSHNRKPKAIFFKYIVDILLNQKYPVIGLAKNIYSYETNFMLNDLDNDQLNSVLSKNKELKFDYLFSDKKKLYELNDNKDVVLFRELAPSSKTLKQYYGIVNVETMEVIKDYEYLVDSDSEFTDTIFIDKTPKVLRHFTSAKNSDEFIILVINPNSSFKIISKEQAKKLIEAYSAPDKEDSKIKKGL